MIVAEPTQLFEIFDTDKNGALDPGECGRAVKELGSLSDHFFGLAIEPQTARQLDEFQAALQQGDIGQAIPIDVRTSEVHSMLGAIAALELRGSLAEEQVGVLNAKMESGMQSARGVEQLRSQVQPLLQYVEYVREALPRIEQKLLRQRNAASCLLTSKLVQSVEQKDVAYQKLASKEMASLEAVATLVRQVEERLLRSNGGEPPPAPRHDEPSEAANCGALEASLPTPPEVRGALSRRWSSEGQQVDPVTSPCRELGTLLLLLSTARTAAAQLRSLVEEAASRE